MKKIFMLIFTIILANGVWAQEYSYQLLQKANSGDKNAQYDMGYVYEWGRGIAENKAMAINWYTKAANNGHLKAMKTLYSHYVFKQSDVQTGIFWMEKAAKHNDWYSYGKLGWYYYEGQGTSKNYSKAVECFTIGAEHNDSGSINGLAYCYAYGKGVSRDFNKAHELIDKNIAKDPKDPNWYDSKGEFYLLMADSVSSPLFVSFPLFRTVYN